MLPWMGDAANLMDRFDARLLLEELLPPGQPPRTGAARAAWEAAATIIEAEPLQEAAIDRERYRDLGAADSDSSDDGACLNPFGNP